MVKICSCCSGISLERLKTILTEEQITNTCIDVCKKHEDKCFGYINGELIYTKSEDEFIERIENNLHLK